MALDTQDSQTSSVGGREGLLAVSASLFHLQIIMRATKMRKTITRTLRKRT